MKSNNYILNQLIISQNQINKNKKYSNAYIKERAYNSFNQSKNHFNSFETLKNEEHHLNDENKLFLNLYAKTKKLYPTKINETFKDLITQYGENNYKIPDLSDKKNLFNQNPLLLVGNELEYFYRGINTSNKLNLKNKDDKKKKHINFIKKEMFMIESIVYNKSMKNYGKDDNKNDSNDINDNNKNSRNKKPQLNYFHVDSVWDKIEGEKLRIKNEKLNEKRLIQRKIYKKNKDNNIKIDIPDNNSKKLINDNQKSIDFDKLNSLSAFSTDKNNYNASFKHYNSKDTMTFKSSAAISSDFKNHSMNSFNNLRSFNTEKNLSPKKVKFKLKIEEKNKLLKEIEEIKSTLNNQDLMEKNITIENYSFKKKNSKINKTINFDKTFGRFLYNNKKSKTIRISKLFSSRSKGSVLLNLFGQKTIKQSIIRKLIKETNPEKIIDMYMKLNLEIFEQKEIEKLIKIYYQKILGHSGESIDKIIKMKLGDDLICELLEKYIKKSKEKSFKYSSNPKVNKSLDKANEEIKALKKRYLIGKTFEIID